MINSVTVVCVLCEQRGPAVMQRLDDVMKTIEALPVSIFGKMIVIDNSGTSIDMPYNPSREYYWNRGYNLSLGGALNQALMLTTTDAIAYVCERHGGMNSTDWLTDILTPLENENVGMSGSVQPCDFSKVAQSSDDIIEPQIHIQGGIWAARASTLRHFGFGYRFPMVFADVDISRRMLAAGFELADVPTVAAVASGRIENREQFKYVHDYD